MNLQLIAEKDIKKLSDLLTIDGVEKEVILIFYFAYTKIEEKSKEFDFEKISFSGFNEFSEFIKDFVEYNFSDPSLFTLVDFESDYVKLRVFENRNEFFLFKRSIYSVYNHIMSDDSRTTELEEDISFVLEYIERNYNEP